MTKTKEEWLVSNNCSVLSSDDEKYIDSLGCYINEKGKLVVYASDHDGHEWYHAETLEEIIKCMSVENAKILYDLLKENLSKNKLSKSEKQELLRKYISWEYCCDCIFEYDDCDQCTFENLTEEQLDKLIEKAHLL